MQCQYSLTYVIIGSTILVMDTTKQEDFGELLKNFRKYFTNPTKDLVKYLISQNIMTPTEIASQMGISRETLYNKYINEPTTK